MKNFQLFSILFICAIFIVSSSDSFAALRYTTKGTMDIMGETGIHGGSASFTNNGQEQPRSTSWGITLSPKFGYFVADSFQLRLTALYDYYQEDQQGYQAVDNAFSFLFGPAYFFDQGSNIFPFMGLGLGYTISTYETRENAGDTPETFTFLGFSAEAYAGMRYLFGEYTFMDLSVQYLLDFLKDSENGNNKKMNGTGLLKIGIGIRF